MADNEQKTQTVKIGGQNPGSRLDQLFGEAIELPPSDRVAFLERACADDPELRCVESQTGGLHRQCPFLRALTRAGARNPQNPGTDGAARQAGREPAGQHPMVLRWLFCRSEHAIKTRPIDMPTATMGIPKKVLAPGHWSLPG